MEEWVVVSSSRKKTGNYLCRSKEHAKELIRKMRIGDPVIEKYVTFIDHRVFPKYLHYNDL